MTLIKSISGIRGTIGGKPGSSLTPLDIVKFSSAYGLWVIGNNKGQKGKVVVGRDARISGEMVEKLVVGSLMGMGLDVVNIGLATTPTTEVAVVKEGAIGGIILTASHNPRQWNALKLLNEKGEFLSAEEGEKILSIAESDGFVYETVDGLGKMTHNDYAQEHIRQVLDLQLVDVAAIKAAGFKVAIDCVNSVGGIILPDLLRALGVTEIIELYTEPNGEFPHNPEPLPEHLTEISEEVVNKKADVGFVVDPDVDRLAIVCEDGSMFGEEYTLVAVADYILKHTPGNTVSNLSSSRALRDITEKYGYVYNAAAVGEVNVVTKMKATKAIIGGEGNGGVIYPSCHSGRDSLVGIALFLSHLAHAKMSVSAMRKTYPEYYISKNKIELNAETPIDLILEKIKENYRNAEVTDIDGVKIDFPDKWVHMRKSNTEPIIRIYSEASTEALATELANRFIEDIKQLSGEYA